MILPRLAMIEIWLKTALGDIQNGPLFDSTKGIAKKATLAFKSTVAYNDVSTLLDQT